MLKDVSKQAKKLARQPPPNYSSRREQIRLFILCGMLMLVLAMMNEARKPEAWRWLWAGGRPDEVENAEPIDTRIDLDEPNLPADGFVADASPTVPVLAKADERVPELTPEILATIKDNTVFRAAENDAWLAMIGALHSREQNVIEQLSLGRVGFAQLFRQTDFYRGQVVTVAGIARRLEAIETENKNELGIGTLYRWILEPQSTSTAPIVVYSIECPDGLTPSEKLRENCEFTGFCFKRWAYKSGDGARVAPLIIAKTCKWAPAPEEAHKPLPSIPFILGSALLLVGLAVAFAAIVFRSSNVERSEIDRLRQPDMPLNHLLDEPVLPSTADALKSMEQEPS